MVPIPIRFPNYLVTMAVRRDVAKRAAATARTEMQHAMFRVAAMEHHLRGNSREVERYERVASHPLSVLRDDDGHHERRRGDYFERREVDFLL